MTQSDNLYSIAEIENAIAHHKRIIATMGYPIPDAIKDAVGMFQQLLDTMRENERYKKILVIHNIDKNSESDPYMGRDC